MTYTTMIYTTTVNDRITLNEGAQLFLEPGPLLCEGVETHIRRTAHFRGLPAIGRQHQDRAGPVRDRYVCMYVSMYVQYVMYVCMYNMLCICLYMLCMQIYVIYAC